MKHLYAILFALFFMSGMNTSMAQTKEVIYKDWTHIAESPKHYEVEYRVLKCDQKDQIHIFLFNENVESLSAEFTVEIVNNADGQKASREVAFMMGRMKMYRTTCDGAELAPLRLDVPAGFDPANLTLKITFKP